MLSRKKPSARRPTLLASSLTLFACPWQRRVPAAHRPAVAFGLLVLPFTVAFAVQGSVGPLWESARVFASRPICPCARRQAVGA